MSLHAHAYAANNSIANYPKLLWSSKSFDNRNHLRWRVRPAAWWFKNSGIWLSTKYSPDAPAPEVLNMIDVVLRAAAPNFDVDKFLGEFSDLHPDAKWKKGEKRLRSRPPSEDAGFNKVIGEGDSWEAAWEQTQHSLGRLGGVLEALTQSGVSACVDVGVLVGAPGFEICHLSLAPADLEYLAKLRLALTFTIYSVNEEKVRFLSK